MTSSEDSTDEEDKGRDDSQDTDLISLSLFDLLEWITKRVHSTLPLLFHYFMMSVCPWISLEKESYWRWILRKISRQCHINPILVTPLKPPDPEKDLYDGRTYDPKTRVDTWTRMDVVPAKCGYFSLLMGLPSIVIIWCDVLFLCWNGLIFGKNWGFIKCPQTQSDYLAEVLDLYGKNSCWFGLYDPKMNSGYPTEIRSMLPLIWNWWHPWWILNVSHVGYLEVFHTIKKMNPFLLIYLQLLKGLKYII